MRRRRAALVFIIGSILLILLGGAIPSMVERSFTEEHATQVGTESVQPPDIIAILQDLPVKGKAPKTGYSREQFGNGWGKTNGCETRDIILYRDLENPVLEGECTVVSGTLHDPYTGEIIAFTKAKSSAVQIDHVVALSNAWQTGAQQLSIETRKQFANDPLNLLAVDGPSNQAKSDSDAGSWLPKNKAFRCEYIKRQVEVKKKYTLWVTEAEKNSMVHVLKTCT